MYRYSRVDNVISCVLYITSLVRYLSFISRVVKNQHDHVLVKLIVEITCN